jgi:hypothetical protein
MAPLGHSHGLIGSDDIARQNSEGYGVDSVLIIVGRGPPIDTQPRGVPCRMA